MIQTLIEKWRLGSSEVLEVPEFKPIGGDLARRISSAFISALHSRKTSDISKPTEEFKDPLSVGLVTPLSFANPSNKED